MIRIAALLKASLLIVGAVSGLFLTWFLLLMNGWVPWQVLYRSEIHAGNVIVGNLERFRAERGKLPSDEIGGELLSLGFEIRTGLYPEFRQAGGEYEIEYYIGFDGPQIIYSSNTRKWRCKLC